MQGTGFEPASFRWAPEVLPIKLPLHFGFTYGTLSVPEILNSILVYKPFGRRMVQNSDISIEDIKNISDSHIRKCIILLLKDRKERSAYGIKNEIGAKISLSAIIEHLQKLVGAGFISCRDATKGKLTRYHYKITNKGEELAKKEFIFWLDKSDEDIQKSVIKFIGKL